MGKFKNIHNSVRYKLFITLAIAVIMIIAFLILLNNIVLESFYLYSKQGTLIKIFDEVNEAYNTSQPEKSIRNMLSNYALRNGYDIMLETQDGINLYTSNENFIETMNSMNILNSQDNNNDIILANKDFNIRKIKDQTTNINYILLSGKLDNNYNLYIRMPISSIQESVKISNNFLYLIGGITLIIAAIIITFISKRFTEPIQELNEIAEKMANLDFSKKFHPKDVDDEINMLGKNINLMSDKLEATIKQLRNSNIRLERDIEEKSKIEEMRTQFISDVSHELKTPIALIQGYAEGLIENVNTDEENRKFYAEVISDEANKMDKLVKQLLELMKLEYGKREFSNANFNIIELISEVIRKSKVMKKEKNIEVRFDFSKPINVYADEFYIEQVVTNYITNAIKHADEVFGEKYIEIRIEDREDKIRIYIFNTGENIEEEDKERIWRRFYKVDSSRNRENGGTGIGLALVKAIMNNYNNAFGVENKDTGVEFYFDLSKSKEE